MSGSKSWDLLFCDLGAQYGKTKYEEFCILTAPNICETAQTIMPRVRNGINALVGTLAVDWDPWQHLWCEFVSLDRDFGIHPEWGSIMSYLWLGVPSLRVSYADLATFAKCFPLLTSIYNYRANFALSWVLMRVDASYATAISRLLQLYPDPWRI